MINEFHGEANMPILGTLGKREMCPIWPLTIYARFGHLSGMPTNSISALRNAKGMTQTELAEAIGTTLNNLGKLERGTRRLNMDWIEKIATALGVEPYQVIMPVGDEDGLPDESERYVNADNLVPLLQALLPLAPSGRASEQSLRALAAALERGIELLGNRASTPASEDALAVAARGALSRFREIGSA
jgi:transcriptional regulator with XRE-family HTH domain